MAAETTATTANDIIGTEAIVATFLDYAFDFAVATPLFRRFQMPPGSKQIQIPRITADIAVDDNGVSADGEFDATEGTALSNIALDTESVTANLAEYGLKRTVTDNIGEDSMMGTAFMTELVKDAARVLTTAVEVDALALFSSLSNSVGSTGVNITIAQAVAMVDGIRNRGYHAPDGAAYVLDNVTWADIRDLLIATGTSWAVYPGAADRFLGAAPEGTQGLATGLVGSLLGFPVWATGQTPTANAGADVVSAAFIPSSPANDGHATFGYAERRPFRMETRREPDLRGEMIVFTKRCLVLELADGAGTKAVTDA